MHKVVSFTSKGLTKSFEIPGARDIFLPRCPRKVWERVGESLGGVTAHRRVQI